MNAQPQFRSSEPLPLVAADHLTDEQWARNFLRRFDFEYNQKRFPVTHNNSPISTGESITRPTVGLHFKVWKGRMCEITQHGRVLYRGKIADFDAREVYAEMD